MNGRVSLVPSVIAVRYLATSCKMEEESKIFHANLPSFVYVFDRPNSLSYFMRVAEFFLLFRPIKFAQYHPASSHEICRKIPSVLYIFCCCQTFLCHIFWSFLFELSSNNLISGVKWVCMCVSVKEFPSCLILWETFYKIDVNQPQTANRKLLLAFGSKLYAFSTEMYS
jgi:hypothetical protein